KAVPPFAGERRTVVGKRRHKVAGDQNGRGSLLGSLTLFRQHLLATGCWLTMAHQEAICGDHPGADQCLSKLPGKRLALQERARRRFFQKARCVLRVPTLAVWRLLLLGE